jgi:hypothetical protein
VAERRFHVELDWPRGTFQFDLDEDELRSWLARMMGESNGVSQPIPPEQFPDDDLAVLMAIFLRRAAAMTGLTVPDENDVQCSFLPGVVFAIRVQDRERQRPRRAFGFAPEAPSVREQQGGAGTGSGPV